jgi:diguanylate cyclase (GGDEF)-like protein/PAS domain S-box-containing protein
VPSSSVLRLLIVEDNERDAELMMHVLRDYGYELAFDVVRTEAAFQEKLGVHLDIILCDNALPSFSSRRALEILGARSLKLPTIVVSGTLSDAEAAEMLRLGAADYLLKDRIQRLGAAVDAAVSRFRMQREVSEARSRVRVAQEHLRNFLDNSPAAIFVKDVTGAYVDVNDEFVRALGVTPHEVLGRTDAQLFDRDVAAEYAANDEQVLNSGRAAHFEERMRHVDGVHETFVVRFPLRDAAGNINGLGGIATDVTERRRIEERYRATFEQNAVGVAHVTRSGRFIEVNDQLCNILRYPCSDVLRTRALHFIHPADRRRARSIAEQMLADTTARSSSGHEMRFITASGGVTWVTIAISVVKAADPAAYFVVMVQDISERKRAESRAALLQATSVAITESRDVQAALRSVLRRICEETGWEFGRAWLPDESEDHLDCEVAWHDPALRFDDPNRPCRIVVGDGRADPAAASFVTQRPLLIRNFASASARLRTAAAAHGIASWIAIPVLSSARSVAVLEFWLTHASDEDAEHTQVIGAVARQLGLLFDRKLAQDRLSYVAQHDALTALPNRTLFNDRLQHALAQAQRKQQTIGVLMLDLARFGQINEVFGYAAGDQVLKAVADRLTASVRAGDTLARFDGDEFAVILPEIGGADDAARVADKIFSSLSAPFEIRGENVYANTRIGITLYPGDHTSAEGLVQNAERAMARAKTEGRSNYEFYSAEMNARALERIRIEHGLRGALKRNEFVLLYQPKVEIVTRRIVGVEALLRWNPGAPESIPPDRFIPYLEESGLIVEVGTWVLQTACSQVRAWLDRGVPAVPVAVNVSAKQLDVDFTSIVAHALSQFALEPRWLELEITESAVMKKPAEAIRALNDVKALGVKIAMDDFGTGYSSLGYLRRLPVDAVKIDRAFVTDIATNAGDAAIARAIINLAHLLGLHVIAEGVENEAQLSFLAANGCDDMQGYLFAPPLPSEAVTDLLTQEVAR